MQSVIYECDPGKKWSYLVHVTYFLIIFSAPGGIAQMARARGSQSRGRGFDSPYLHNYH